MKASLFNLFIRALLFVLCLAAAAPADAQQDTSDFFTVDGIVRDDASGRPIPGVSVSVPGARIGTVTNADGTFSIKIGYGLRATGLEFSHLGYNLARLPVENRDTSDFRVGLTPAEAIVIPGVTVVNEDARRIVEEAIRRIGSNYSDRANMLTGFYRETVQKRSGYVDIAEAVVEIHRSPYTEATGGDRVRVVKGRRLVSPRASDTLFVKLQGGPNVYFQCDVVKNRDLLLDEETLKLYNFSLEEPSVIDDRPHYTVAFSPGVIFSDYALFVGRLYIDRETLTISRAEYALDMTSREKATAMILRRKPATLRFIPQEVSYVLNYQRQGGRSYLYYIGFRIRFRCDWRRRLFA